MLCYEDAKQNNKKVSCFEFNFCDKIQGSGDLLMPPELNYNSKLAFELYEKIVSFSGYDGMSRVPKIDKIDWVLNNYNGTIEKDDYDILLEKIVFINTISTNLILERQQQTTKEVTI